MTLVSILASFWEPFGFIFSSCSASIFTSFFGCPFFRLLAPFGLPSGFIFRSLSEKGAKIGSKMVRSANCIADALPFFYLFCTSKNNQKPCECEQAGPQKPPKSVLFRRPAPLFLSFGSKSREKRLKMEAKIRCRTRRKNDAKSLPKWI